MIDKEIDAPALPQQGEMGLSTSELRWLHVRDRAKAEQACAAELQRMMTRLSADTAMPDITFLSGKSMGGKLVEMQRSIGVNMLHTFGEDTRESQRQKRAFFQGDPRVKATTIHSFKGWEARHLIVFVESVGRAEDKAALYTALTRLRRHEHGSSLSVVSCCEELRPYGSSWPEYKAI